MSSKRHAAFRNMLHDTENAASKRWQEGPIGKAEFEAADDHHGAQLPSNVLSIWIEWDFDTQPRTCSSRKPGCPHHVKAVCSRDMCCQCMPFWREACHASSSALRKSRRIPGREAENQCSICMQILEFVFFHRSYTLTQFLNLWPIVIV
jgi:hypothetical protein